MIFHNKKLFIFSGLILIVGICFFIENSKIEEDVLFEDFPSYSSGFNNDQIEKSINNYLLTENNFSWKTREDSFNFCAVENLDPDKQLFPLCLWAYCGEYVLENGDLKMISGYSTPLKIDYPNELSFYRLDKFSYEAPRGGSYYEEDIQALFPEEIREKIFNFESENISKKLENYALQNILSWEEAKIVINNCEVEKVFQTHNREVTLTLKNGREMIFIEPKIDKIFEIIKESFPLCGEIKLSTE